jgi:DNA-binding LytR/AlgR family response regulator
VMLSRKFSDCLEKLKPFTGLQVHRSHWVRSKHVDQIKAKGSSYLCILSDGNAIPVSRRRHAELKLILRR